MLGFPVHDWQFWVVTLVATIVIVRSLRAIRRTVKRPTRRVQITMERERIG